MNSQAQRNPEEEGDYMAFEQLVAEAAAKKEKDGKKKGKKGADDGKHHHHHPATAEDVAGDVPNVPKS